MTRRMTVAPSLLSVSDILLCTAFTTKFLWVRMAPFGIPVVPPVYCRSAVSPGDTAVPTDIAGSSLMRSMKSYIGGTLFTLIHNFSNLAFMGYSMFNGNGRKSLMPQRIKCLTLVLGRTREMTG